MWLTSADNYITIKTAIGNKKSPVSAGLFLFFVKPLSHRGSISMQQEPVNSLSNSSPTVNNFQLNYFKSHSSPIVLNINYKKGDYYGTELPGKTKSRG